MTENLPPADPSGFAVEITRDASERVNLIRVIDCRGRTWGDGEAIYDAMDDTEIGRFIAMARDEEHHDPDDETLPSDRAFILAALRDLGIPIQGEGEGEGEAWRDVALTVRRRGSADVFWTGPAGVMHDQNEDENARAAIRAVASGDADGCDIGGGATTEFVLTRADQPFSLDDHDDLIARMAAPALNGTPMEDALIPSLATDPCAELLKAAREAEAFMSGFEGDEAQDPPIDERLARLRAAIARMDGR